MSGLRVPYARKVVLHCPTGARFGLAALVEQFLADGVAWVGAVGVDCGLVEDIIDEIVVGDGSDDSRFILTSAHPDASIAEVIEFGALVTSAGDGPVQVVELRGDVIAHPPA